MRNLFLIVMLFGLSSSYTWASEPVPGDSCASYPEGSVVRSGGPELGGVHYVMVCEDGIWGGGDPCLQDGMTVPHGDSATFYNAEESANCISISQSRSCINGSLDGSSSYAYASCSPPVSGCDNIGDECNDGSFYIGDSPEDGHKVYMTSSAYEAIGVRWDSNSCEECGDGTVATSFWDGRANTENVLAFDPDGFEAAAYCDGLTNIHGHSDWYLPAGGNTTGTEQHLFYAMYQAVGTVGGIGGHSEYYWSSTELDDREVRIQRFVSPGNISTDRKDDENHVRCVRR